MEKARYDSVCCRHAMTKSQYIRNNKYQLEVPETKEDVSKDLNH
jgi:hypothetical protein